MQRPIKINNKTRRKIDTNKWKSWINTYCDYAPLSVFVIYSPKKENKMDLKGGYLFEEIYIFVEKGEDEKSINHTFLHELAHWIIDHKKDMSNWIETSSNELEDFLIKNKVSKKQIKSKYFQDTLSYEEVFADMFAIMVLGLE